MYPTQNTEVRPGHLTLVEFISEAYLSLITIEAMATKKLNVDLTWEQVYNAVKTRESIEFNAGRNDIGFQNVEIDFPHQNWLFPIIFDVVALPSIEFIFYSEASGIANPLTPIQRVQLATKLNGGNILYQKIGAGEEWKLSVVFRNK